AVDVPRRRRAATDRLREAAVILGVRRRRPAAPAGGRGLLLAEQATARRPQAHRQENHAGPDAHGSALVSVPSLRVRPGCRSTTAGWGEVARSPRKRGNRRRPPGRRERAAVTAPF